MGNYNPHAPYILGHEWVPIRQANYEPDVTNEQGYIFRLNHATTPVSGAYYISKVPDFRVSSVNDLISVYPASTAKLTGPIKKVNIPVSAISVTGTSFNTADGFQALNNPTDGKSIVFKNSGFSGNDYIAFQFDTEGYSQQLFGKRILDVKIRYSMKGLPSDVSSAGKSSSADIQMSVGFLKNLSDTIFYGNPEVAPVVLFQFDQPHEVINSFSLKNVNAFWDATTLMATQRDIYPWRYQEINRFRATEGASTKMCIAFLNNLTTAAVSNAFLYFMDMEILYCEETRVAYGGRRTAYFGISPNSDDTYSNGAQFVRLRDTNFNLGVSLTPNEYLLTLLHTNFDISTFEGAPTVNSLRELYQLIPQRGTELVQTLTVDEEFDQNDLATLTHLTLHTASSVVTGVHAYGQQYGAPVYSSTSPIQEIEDDPVSPAALFPQVRFYARRFGNTTIPLTLTDVATGLSTVSISVADFDALPEIVDGWKEVTLRFATAPTFSATGGDIDWKWTAAGELAGNQWQILAASGPSPTGTQSIAKATYYAPQGDTVTLTWMSPPISGTAEDNLGDATLIFSQDPFPVSGFALSTASQVITGIALNCGTPPGCVPTGIGYINLTWSAQTVLPVTGFGAYELERMDLIDGTWQQIMNATSPFVTGFADFEARVGQTSWYRIRTCNVLDFCGPWITGSASIPSPGVAIQGDGNSVLIMTSNKAAGSNLAYVMQWEDEPIETFAFPEASFIQLQQLFGKDFFTAFHPLERGGEQFTRAILINAAAIPLRSLANFKQLRDLGWASLPYVCVRDELGNRWYSAIRIPEGIVRNNRTIYIAQIEVTEVTSTPFPVDPAS